MADLDMRLENYPYPSGVPMAGINLPWRFMKLSKIYSHYHASSEPNSGAAIEVAACPYGFSIL